MELTAELETKLVRRLFSEWENLNWSLFGNVLRAPLIQLLRAETRLGEWRSRERTLALSRHEVLSRPWVETLEILKHEMAHQFVDEILGGEPEPHGPRFRSTCASRGIDAAAVQRGERPASETRQEDRVITRVRKLLALAESSNQHEAELAASTAQRIMMKFNVDLEAHAPADANACSSLWLGAPTGRVQAHERRLACILIEFFFVQGIWISVYRPLEGKNGTVLEICGRPENLQMAEFVYAFLLRTTERLWAEHKRVHAVSSDRDRRNFLAGAMEGFASKLAEQRKDARREGLVWVGGSAAEAHLHRRYPRMTTSRHTEDRGRAGYAEGKSAGREIVLSRPMTSAETEHGPRRALTSGK